MILTVTMNPSIDTAYHIDHLVIDDVNRVVPEKTAGGKGLNVSRVLVQLGDDVLATGLLGGHMGEFLADRMNDDEIPNDFTPIAGDRAASASRCSTTGTRPSSWRAAPPSPRRSSTPSWRISLSWSRRPTAPRSRQLAQGRAC